MRLNFMDVIDLIDPNGNQGIWLDLYKPGSAELQAKINTSSKYLDMFSSLEIIRIAAVAPDEFALRIGEETNGKQ